MTSKAAIGWLLEEKNISGHKGEEAGSEMYALKLPSGTEVSNWRVDSMFRNAFHPFGDVGRKFLIPYLDHEHAYVRVGAYAVLNHIIYSQARINYNFQMPEVQRKKAVSDLQAWWAKNKERVKRVGPPDQ